jgi:hypothetical protein
MPTLPYGLKSGSAIPGAYLVNGGIGSFPIFYSLTDYNNYFMNDIDDGYWVLPGFHIIVYSASNYTGDIVCDANNTDGSYTFYYTNSSVNRGSSCRLYYNNEQF